MTQISFSSYHVCVCVCVCVCGKQRSTKRTSVPPPFAEYDEKEASTITTLRSFPATISSACTPKHCGAIETSGSVYPKINCNYRTERTKEGTVGSNGVYQLWKIPRISVGRRSVVAAKTHDETSIIHKYRKLEFSLSLSLSLPPSLSLQRERESWKTIEQASDDENFCHLIERIACILNNNSYVHRYTLYRVDEKHFLVDTRARHVFANVSKVKCLKLPVSLDIHAILYLFFFFFTSIE